MAAFKSEYSFGGIVPAPVWGSGFFCFSAFIRSIALLIFSSVPI
nr:MAG TPA: hypothetical protein [Caudoviricetes sp.]